MMVDLIKFIACSAFLMLLFRLFLAKEKTFLLNRWLLIILIPAAMVVPLLSIPVFVPQEIAVLESAVQTSFLQQVQQQFQASQVIDSSATSTANSPLFWFLTIYLVVSMVLLIIKSSALIRLIHWTKMDSLKPMKGAMLILSEKALSPFSFGKFIFMHPSTYKEDSGKTEMILKHELAHIKQSHYIDLAIMEFFTVVFWFNPIVFAVKKAMVLNHEYLADQEVQNTVHPIKYKKLLLKLTVQNTSMALISAISSSTLKHRLIMLNKPSKKTTMRLRIVYFSLSTLLIVAGFSLKINAHQSRNIPASTYTPLLKHPNLTLDMKPEFQGEISNGEINSNKNALKVKAKYSNGMWKGTVQDSKGKLLAGAIIIIEQPKTKAPIGTVTDINGNFSIKASSTATLIVSFKEYKSVKLKQN
ncbi:M56 family metallopeptidase [uncultured Cyclobacterium sp.]|uniref:M56 family metallopeptidase n=1 Tax=uncultured Cyclobacterium sp. TaxID=453820 RepID=UPI0030EB97A9|tara:strand:- start:36568 stop:37812 length:1245 start_codon:yes stop_codon:yes gene_type:complete